MSEKATVELNVKKARKVFKQFRDDSYEYQDELSKNRLGKVLTIIDSAIADETQRKAVKDLINDAWYSSQPRSGKFYHGQPGLHEALSAIGFDMYDKTTPDIEPAHVYNPYEQLVKD